MPITGVTPLPAVRKSNFSGGGSGSTNSPAGCASRTTVPGSSPSTRCLDRKPSGIALTVTEMCPLPPSVRSCLGGEVSEYERQCQVPSTSTAMPMYWPGSCSNDQPHPGLMTSVAASSVSWMTFSTRPRNSRADQSGLIIDR